VSAPSPWLGGPGARWAQALLFLLHVALLVSLVILFFTLQDVRHRVAFERWQEWLLIAGIVVSFLVFARRAWGIGRDLWRAVRGIEPAGGDEDDS